MQLREATVSIVGLGLMGGSLALALRDKCGRLVGVARRAEIAELALRNRVVDSAGCDMQAGVAGADIVVLATPVRHILASIPEVATHMRPGALLMDMGSTKARVVAALDRIPPCMAAVGGHPMCGKEVGGLESADACLFIGATFVLTPTARTTGEALLLAHELAEATGARPLVMEAEAHDSAAALISHLPYLLASSLVQAEARAQDHAADMLAASGFRDTSRLAASQVDMMLDTLLTNRQSVGAALDLFEQEIARARGLLNDPEGLKSWMEAAQARRRGMFQ